MLICFYKPFDKWHMSFNSDAKAHVENSWYGLWIVPVFCPYDAKLVHDSVYRFNMCFKIYIGVGTFLKYASFDDLITPG